MDGKYCLAGVDSSRVQAVIEAVTVDTGKAGADLSYTGAGGTAQRLTTAMKSQRTPQT